MSKKSTRESLKGFFRSRSPHISTLSIDRTKSSSSSLTEPCVPPKPPARDVPAGPMSTEPREPVNISMASEASTPSSSPAVQTHVPHSVPPPVTSKEPQSANEPVGPIPVLSTSQRLWNTAYESLMNDNETAPLVTSYIEVLTRVLAGKEPDISSSGDITAADLDDPIKRQAYMRTLVDEGRKKVAPSTMITKRVGDVVKFIEKAKQMIDVAIQSIPQAALPWAGVCIGLQILSNPSKGMESQLLGIPHVVSRMNRYCALTEDLLNKDHIVTGSQSLEAVLKQLEEAVIELYKALLLYQMKSVWQGVVFLRGLVNLDDWDGELKRVTDAEATVRGYSAQYLQEHTKVSLGKHIQLAEGMETQLTDIHQDLQDIIALEKETRMDDKSQECLRQLYVINPQHDMETLEGKKEELHSDASKWIFERPEYKAFTDWDQPDSPRLLWIKGPAGTGKTMLLIGIVRELERQSTRKAPSPAYFFCQGAGDQNLNTATAALKSLMWMLLLQQPVLLPHLQSKYENTGPSLFSNRDTFQALFGVFKNILNDPQLSPTYLIVDALDELNEGLAELLKLISTSLTFPNNKVRWLVSSRPDVDLMNQDKVRSLVELDTSVLEGPVDTYIAYKLSTLERNGGWDRNTLTEISTHIRRRAMNTFLWVALVFKELGPVESYDAIQIIDDIPSGLSELYGHIMTKIKKGQRKDPEYCGKVLTATCLAYRRLSLHELVSLTNFPGKRIEDMESIVRKCGSFLTITRGEVSLIHQSAKDYLLSEVGILSAMPIEAHGELVLSSLNSMSEKLKRDNYGLRHPGFSIDKVQRPDPDPLASIRYACEYWVDHLCDGGSDPSIAMGDLGYQEHFSDEGRVHQFLRQHLLHWFEALSLIGKISKGIIGLHTLEKQLTKPPQGNALQHKEFVHDAIRVFRQCRIAVEEAPLQVYYSALIFSPEKSVVRRTFQQEIPTEISVRPQASNNWNPCLQTLEGHKGPVLSVAFSPNGQQLAVAVGDDTIRLWDASTGESIRALNCGISGVSSVAFSPDGQRLASGYYQSSSVQLWDVSTGELLLDIDGGIAPVALAPDGQRLAYCSRDNALQLCDAGTGRHLQTFEGHKANVTSIVFSPNGRQLVSGSGDYVIRLWDTSTSECLRTLEGHTAKVTSVAFSPDQAMARQQLASGSYDTTIRLWDASTGECLRTLKGHDGVVASIAFSPNRQQLTLGSEDSASLLASGSKDGTVRLWDTNTGDCVRIFNGYSGLEIPAAFSPDGQQLASAYKRGTVQLWDTSATKYLPTPESRKELTTVIAVSLDGHRLALGLEEGTIQLWDANTMEHLYTLQGHEAYINSLVFSPDGQWLASGSYDDTVRLWDTLTRESQYAPTIHGGLIVSVAFPPHGQRLAVGSVSGPSGEQVWLCDTRTMEHLHTLGSTKYGAIYSIGFSPDGQRLAVGLGSGAIELWDASTGECLNTLKSDQRWCSPVAFSPDRQLLASASQYEHTVQLWDVGTGECLQTKQPAYDITPGTSGWKFYPDFGTVVISQTLQSDHIQWIGCGIDPERVWITWKGENLLWLPPEHRPRKASILFRDNRVWIGCDSGRVYSLTICAEDTSYSD